MADTYASFTGKIDRRNPRNKGDINSPMLRENLISRDGRLKKPDGTEIGITGFTDEVTWSARYYTVETGVASPKSFAYTQDGKLWVVDTDAKTATVLPAILNPQAFPNALMFKTQNQNIMYLVDGLNLWKYDGNNDNEWVQVTVVDSNDDPVEPIDLVEHKDRLCLISNAFLFISANLAPETFDDATDSLQIIVGSGKGGNLSVEKIEDFLFVFNTEGIYGLEGDTISAVAITFELRLVEERNILAGRSAVRVEKAILFIASDYELWSFDGRNTKMLSYLEKLKDSINDSRDMLNKAVAHYDKHTNYYMLSFVEKGKSYNNLEIWWDAIDDKIEFIRGRNVSCYMQTDSTKEQNLLMLGRSDALQMDFANRGRDFASGTTEIKLTTRDITPKVGHNVRFIDFYPELEPTGERNMFFRYLLDGRLSDLDAEANWNQALDGEAKVLGLIRIRNQAQFTGRVRPKINYAKGQSVAFEIYDKTPNLTFSMLGIRIDYVVKPKKKGKLIGQ